jgi:hypothetical protein
VAWRGSGGTLSRNRSRWRREHAYIPHVQTVNHAASTVARRRGLIVLALGVMTACGEAGILVDETTVNLGTDAEQAPEWKPTPQEPLTIELTSPPTARPGDEVAITVRVHNGSDRPVGVGFGQRRAFDVLVARAQGRADSSAVWSLPKFYSPVRDVTVTDPVAPGRDTVFSVIWPGVDDAGQKVPPGAYRIRATVSAELVSRRQLWTEWRTITVRK